MPSLERRTVGHPFARGSRVVPRAAQRALVAAVVLFTLVAPALAAAPPDPDAAPSTGSNDTSIEEDVAGNAQFQTPDEAETYDLTLVAEARGWTLEQARSHRVAVDAVGDIAERVAAEVPDLFVGSSIDRQHDAVPVLYIKGPASETVRDWVSASDVEIQLSDDQLYSFSELEERKLAVHRAAEGMGFRDVVTSFDITNRGRISLEVSRGDRASPPTAEDVLSLLSPALRDEVDVTMGVGSIARDEHAFGGNRVLDDGTFECTSGWSVSAIGSGTTGVTTAGHCGGINQIVEPGVGTWGLIHQAQHRGQWGDIEWKTSSHAEPDDFYADNGVLRDVAAVEARGNLSVGEPVCVFGRATNDRYCGADINDTSVSCTNDGVFNDRLVLMSNGTGTTNKDSGGGWSFANTAFGGHKGKCGFLARNAFSVADLFDEAIGVRVRT